MVRENVTKLQGNVAYFWQKTSRLGAKLTGLIQRLTWGERSGQQNNQSVAALPPAPRPVHVQQFLEITPPDFPLPLENTSVSVAFFKDSLFLAAIHYAPDRLEETRRVLRYEAKSASWETLYQEVLPAGPDSVAVAYGVGDGASPLTYQLETGAVVAPSRDNALPRLYISLFSSAKFEVLQSSDGAAFASLNTPRPGYQVQFFKDRVYALPVLEKFRGSKQSAVVYVADSLESDTWQAANTPGFGDSNNQAITALTVFQNALYAGTLNPVQGFQLWKTTADGDPPYTWELVLEKGGYGYALNALVTSLAAFQGNLYGASSLPIAKDQVSLGFYWAGSEIYRLYPNNEWDLIVGTPKYTPEGLKVPLSVMGPGFETPPSSPVYPVQVVHDGMLYTCVQNLDSFHLWVTGDGEQWSSVDIDGLSEAFRVDVSQALSTPLGLVLVVDRIESVDIGQKQVWLCQTSPGS